MRVWLVGLLFGCASASPPTKPASRPQSSLSGPELEVALRVAEAAGIRELRRVAQLDFTFVVTDGDKRLFEARHRWAIADEKDHVTWTDREGHVHDVVVDLKRRTAQATVDGTAVEGEALAKAAEAAYARWINDSYWLMLPVKLFDPGVRLERLPDRTLSGEKHQVLRISYDGVGLTPGDVYVLLINQAHRIVRWEMQLQGQENAPPKGVSWTDYRPVGPLLLAHDHVMDGSGRRVLFEGTQAHLTVNPADFSL